MINTTATSVSLTALALVLLAPDLADAKQIAAHTRGTHPLVSSVSHLAPAPINQTTKGTIDTAANGDGTYTKTVMGTANDKVVTTTDTFADGVTVTSKSTDLTIKNSNGSTSYDDTSTSNGKVTTSDETYTATGVKGDYTVTGVVVQANGQVDNVSGTSDKTSYGTDNNFTLTNSSDKTETLNTETLVDGNVVANVQTGTGFNGKAIDNVSLYTSGPMPTTPSVDTTPNGLGSYATGSNIVNGVKTVYSDRMFPNGAASASSDVITSNANGSTTYAQSTNAIASNGAISSSGSNETYTPNASGGDSISGTFTQSNGYNGTVTGSEVKTGYGNDISLTYKDQSNVTRVADTQQLVDGNITLNVNTGTTFTGQASDSVGLIVSP